MPKLTKRGRGKSLANLYILIGVGKILDILWDNSYYSLGKLASDRIEKEMIYYFGKNWCSTMYKLIDKNPEPIKTLKEIPITERK